MSFLDRNSLLDRNLIEKIAVQYHLTFQQQKILSDMALDFSMWKIDSLSTIWEKFAAKKSFSNESHKKRLTAKIIKDIQKYHQSSLQEGMIYQDISKEKKKRSLQYRVVSGVTDGNIVGACPVYSEKTRCCNLITIDAVKSCAFDCSYCSIQSFYNHGEIFVEKDLRSRLDEICIDPCKRYHFGTGQSSDSLFWGNRFGHLDALFGFARKYPNVIVELKSKSDNIDYLMKADIPKNVLLTWSLNPSSVVMGEEHFTASVDQRIASAASIASKGNLVGFHFHPIFKTNNFEKDYENLVGKVLNNLSPESVALISFGTLTFSKNAMNQIRERKELESQVLRFEKEKIAGKFSYSLVEKEYIFSFIYQLFASWHKEVYFYLCMEDHNLWEKVFQYSYKTNDDFEKSMLESYFHKINL